LLIGRLYCFKKGIKVDTYLFTCNSCVSALMPLAISMQDVRLRKEGQEGAYVCKHVSSHQNKALPVLAGMNAAHIPKIQLMFEIQTLARGAGRCMYSSNTTAYIYPVQQEIANKNTDELKIMVPSTSTVTQRAFPDHRTSAFAVIQHLPAHLTSTHTPYHHHWHGIFHLPLLAAAASSSYLHLLVPLPNARA